MSTKAVKHFNQLEIIPSLNIVTRDLIKHRSLSSHISSHTLKICVIQVTFHLFLPNMRAFIMLREYRLPSDAHATKHRPQLSACN